MSGQSAMGWPYLGRGEFVGELELAVGRVQVPPYWTDVDPQQLLRAVEDTHSEGIAAKHLDSYPDQPGYLR
ncbi:hypothetical protein ACFXG4_48655 [Nocardia sp. NPDC059246]|uniref:hypothetical protein n=1 Tax=unclassified Nocardia TaxID=2637762 RepID=UPI00369281C6